jgi:hypothetical protein
MAEKPSDHNAGSKEDVKALQPIFDDIPFAKVKRGEAE